MKLSEVMTESPSLSQGKTYLVSCANGQIVVGTFTDLSTMGTKSFARFITTSGKDTVVNLSYLEQATEL